MISKLNLQKAKLNNLQLFGIRLCDADLRKTDLTGTKLGAADLRGADLREAVLQHTEVWTAGWASDLYPSADGPDRVWLAHPRAKGLAVLVQIETSGGRIAAYHYYDGKSSKLRSDGQSLYRVPLTTQKQKAEVAQWLGEGIPVESWTLLSESAPLASKALSGAVWQVSANRAILYDDDNTELQLFSHNNGEVRGTLGVSKTSLFAQQQLDGFYLVGTRLWVVGPNMHKFIGEGLALDQQLLRIAAVGETRVVFKAGAEWYSWEPLNKLASVHPELAGVNHIVTFPQGGFALVRPDKVEFVDENFRVRGTQSATTNTKTQFAGIKREGRLAIVVRDNQALYLIDEKMGREALDWLKLQAKGARFNGQTVLSHDLRTALTSAGAIDTSNIPDPLNTIQQSEFKGPKNPPELEASGEESILELREEFSSNW